MNFVRLILMGLVGIWLAIGGVATLGFVASAALLRRRNPLARLLFQNPVHLAYIGKPIPREDDAAGACVAAYALFDE